MTINVESATSKNEIHLMDVCIGNNALWYEMNVFHLQYWSIVGDGPLSTSLGAWPLGALAALKWQEC